MTNEELLQEIQAAKASGANELDLSNSGITELPQEICQLTKLETLRLDGNPLCCPPLEICTQGIEAMRQYFKNFDNGTQILNEAKILIVGDGEAGKTSLVKQLQGLPYSPEEDTTHGINIQGWDAKIGGRKIKTKIWDFGGQEMQHATHQFFFSKRCLYILVLDGRREEEPGYWLHHIRSFGGDSPVLVVTNKKDAHARYNLDHADLRQKHPNIRQFFRTSCKTGEGIAEFKKTLEAQLAEVEMTAIRWPKNWLAVKQRVERMRKDYLESERYETICKEKGITEETSKETLLDFLHDLGVAVHFKGLILNAVHVLRPEWVTNAVYKIITAEETVNMGGRLSSDSVEKIFRHTGEKKCPYNKGTHGYILKLMRRFELCYDIGNETVLIPQVLPADRPDLPFDRRDALRFTFHYSGFLPPSVFPRFMVKVHKDIKDGLCWRTGVLLEDRKSGTLAEVKADAEVRRINLWVRGPLCKEYLNFLWYSLRKINESFENLHVSERVPMPDNPDITADYQTMLEHVEQGLSHFIPEGSKKVYSVHEVLGLVEPDSEDQIMELLLDIRKKLDEKDVVEIKPGAFGIAIDVREAFRQLLPRRELPRQ
jgi:internalin A